MDPLALDRETMRELAYQTVEIRSDDWAALEAIGRRTHTGPMSGPGGEIPPTGKSLALPFCSTLEIKDGKIVAGRDYYNLAAIMEQLGLMPEPAVTTA